jgi:hypothetical protein
LREGDAETAVGISGHGTTALAGDLESRMESEMVNRRSFFTALAALVVAPKVVSKPRAWFDTGSPFDPKLVPLPPDALKTEIDAAMFEMNRLTRHYAYGEWPCSTFNHPPCGAGLRGLESMARIHARAGLR